MASIVARCRDLLASRWALPAICALALALRVGHLVALRSTLWFDNLDLDPRYFDEWGKTIAAGDWLGDRMFFVDPLYPYFLGALYSVFGHSLLAVRLVHLALGVGTVYLTAQIGRKLATPAIGNGAALIYAVYRPAIFNELEIEKTALATFLLALAILCALSERRRSHLFAGLALGTAALCRTNVALLCLPVGLYIARTAETWRPRSAALFALGFALMLAPVVARNRYVGGEWALVTSGGQNLYIGNNPYNTSGGYASLPFIRSFPLYEEHDFAAVAEARTGRRMSPGEVSGYWRGQAIAHLRARSGFAAQMLLRKAALVLNDYEVPDNQDMYFVARYSPVLRLPLPTLGWVLPLAALGLIAQRRSRPALFIAALWAIYTATTVVFFVLARYRIPMVPFLAVLAAFGIAWLAQGRPPWRKAAVAAAVALGLAAFSFRELPFHDRTVNTGLSWHNLGVLQARVGKDADALVSYQKAAQLLPGNAEVFAKLGAQALALGRLDIAEQAFEHCVRIDASLAVAWEALGTIYVQTGRPDQAQRAYDRAATAGSDHKAVRP